MEELIKTLTPMNATLLGAGYDSRLEYLKMLLDLDILEFPTGTRFGSWEVPEEWIVREAWVKKNGKKIIDFAEEPLSLMSYSLPFKGEVTAEELKDHLHYSESRPNSTPFAYKFYERDWGFSVPQSKIMKKVNDKWEYKLKGKYEVFIDTEFRPGKMKIGVHTIPGETDREILLFAHLDHPFMSNDNLSGVACLVDLAKKLKSKHTVKIIFCPETIGSIAYGYTQNLHNVDFVIALDICGNDNSILFQKSFNQNERINRVTHCALQTLNKSYRKGQFRSTIGSDEYYFNDPQVGIPGIMLSRHPYPEYHTAEDKPEKINYEMIKETGELISKIIEIYEKDYVPVRKNKGPIMRSRYQIETPSKQINLTYDYLFYYMDGKKTLAEICCDLEMNFDIVYEQLEKLIEDNEIFRVNVSQVSFYQTA